MIGLIEAMISHPIPDLVLLKTVTITKDDLLKTVPSSVKMELMMTMMVSLIVMIMTIVDISIMELQLMRQVLCATTIEMAYTLIVP